MNQYKKIFLEKVYEIHDIDCNQKYDKVYPYSLHLKAVVAQVKKYSRLFPSTVEINAVDPKRFFTNRDYWLKDLELAGAGHDLIEDARLTYNDVKNLFNPFVADIIYSCTELRGKNRSERHGEVYFLILSEERWAVFIKLCDIIANTLYSLLTNSRMYKIYQKEFSNIYNELHKPGEFEPMWDDLRELLKE